MHFQLLKNDEDVSEAEDSCAIFPGDSRDDAEEDDCDQK